MKQLIKNLKHLTCLQSLTRLLILQLLIHMYSVFTFVWSQRTVHDLASLGNLPYLVHSCYHQLYLTAHLEAKGEREEGREEGRDRGRKGGREGEREGEREEGRERGREILLNTMMISNLHCIYWLQHVTHLPTTGPHLMERERK